MTLWLLCHAVTVITQAQQPQETAARGRCTFDRRLCPKERIFLSPVCGTTSSLPDTGVTASENLSKASLTLEFCSRESERISVCYPSAKGVYHTALDRCVLPKDRTFEGSHRARVPDKGMNPSGNILGGHLPEQNPAKSRCSTTLQSVNEGGRILDSAPGSASKKPGSGAQTIQEKL